MPTLPRSCAYSVMLGLVLICAVLGCEGGQTGSEGSPGGKPGSNGDGGGGAGGVGGSGGPGGMSGMGTGCGVMTQGPCASCSTNEGCMRDIEDSIAKLRQPVQLLPHRLVAAECEQRSIDGKSCPGPAYCKCISTFDYPGEVTAEAFAVGLGLEGGCDVRSRSGACLIEPGEFSGCEPGDACSCAKACEHAQTVRDADWARVLDIEVRHAECTPDNMCRGVVQVGDRCKVFGGPEDIGYDCALSDAEILRRAFPRPPDAGPAHECTDRVCDGGTSTTAITGGSGGCSIGIGVCVNCYHDASALECSDADGG